MATDKNPEQEKILPTFTARHHMRPVVRVGLILGLASAGILVIRELVSSNLFLLIYHLNHQEIEMVVNILNLMALIGVSLGLAGNITVSTTLPRRTAAWVSLALVGGFIFYVTSFFISEYNWQTMNLAWFIAGGIVVAFPQACVSIVLRRKGRLPKAMAPVSCAFGAYSVLQNCITYFRLFAPTLDLDPAALWLISGVGFVLRYVFYFLWCGVWVDLNVRPARYLVKQIPPSRRMRGWRRISLKRKFLVIIIAGGCAGGIVIASLTFSGVFAGPMTQEQWGEFSSQGYVYANDFWGNGSAFYTTGCSQAGSLLIRWDTGGNAVWNRTWVNADYYKGGERVWGNESCVVTLSEYRYNPSLMNTGEYLVKWGPDGSVLKNWSIYDKSATFAHAVIGNGSYLYTAGSAIGGDCAIVKWDTAGNIVWKKTPSGTGSGTDMVIVDGYIYLLGSMDGGGGTMLLKYAENGTLIWQYNYPLGEDATPNHLWWSGEYFYASGDNINFGSVDSFLMKWTRDGELVWTKVDEDHTHWYNAFGCWGVETGFITYEIPPPPVLSPRIVKWNPDGTRQWRQDLPNMEVKGIWVDDSTFIFCGTDDEHHKLFFAKYSYNENFTFNFLCNDPNWREEIYNIERLLIAGLVGLVIFALLANERLKTPGEPAIRGKNPVLGKGLSGLAGSLSIISGLNLPYLFPFLYTPVNAMTGAILQGFMLAGAIIMLIGTGVTMGKLDFGHHLIFWGALVGGINILALVGTFLIAKSPPNPNKPVLLDQETLKQPKDARRLLGANVLKPEFKESGLRIAQEEGISPITVVPQPVPPAVPPMPSPRSKQCPACGASVPVDQKYCDKCGAPL